VRKLVVSSPRGEREIPLTENVFVGRDPACAIRDDDPQLSRRHAEFVAGRDGVVVRDPTAGTGSASTMSGRGRRSCARGT
jgi:pSer/pThr/pTyr-binding forkhead associated (FHA) protein